MKILVTGANGFIGRNLCASLQAIRDGKDRTHPELNIEELLLWTRDTDAREQAEFCREADFVFHLAGVNRPKDAAEFQKCNGDLTAELFRMLARAGNRCPVMLASSVQASLMGRYAGSLYGASKQAGEEAAFAHQARGEGQVLVYRFPNVFGKWCRPDYNSVVATFCDHIARNQPITVNDPQTELELLYIDDLVQELLGAVSGSPHRCDYAGVDRIPAPQGSYCYVPTTHRILLSRIVELLEEFRDQPRTLQIPEQPEGSFSKKLYATYLSYLPREAVAFRPKTNADSRGSFTELFKTENSGQISVNISKPGITKGQHWHNTKWEFFAVVSGHGLIRERRIGSDEVLEFEVSGQDIQVVHMLPGYTHSLVNLSTTEDMVTVMWANELFDPNRPDTFYEEV